MAFGIYQLYQRIQPGFRQRRIRWFIEWFQPGQNTRILDVGGFLYDWDGVVPIESQITLLNLYHLPAANLPSRFTLEIGDARRLPHADRSFDIGYSNSVIEHLGTFENQQLFAAEIRRVGRQLFVQTPNRWFFIESHFLTVFVHFLPWRIARKLIRFCSYRGWFRKGDNVDLQQLATELRLLDFRQMQMLFPDCEIRREKWLGLTKSLIAVRRDPPK
jgi:hypothetical protein